jgi:hypothetical protein
LIWITAASEARIITARAGTPDRDSHVPLHRRRGIDPPARGTGRRIRRLLGEHRRALRQAFERQGGVVVDTQGDAFFVAFARARAPLRSSRRVATGPLRCFLHVPRSCAGRTASSSTPTIGRSSTS